MKDCIPKKYKPKSLENMNPIIPNKYPEKTGFKPSEYMDNIYCSTLSFSTSGKYSIKLSTFDFGTPKK